jgi:hypothetical protein
VSLKHRIFGSVDTIRDPIEPKPTKVMREIKKSCRKGVHIGGKFTEKGGEGSVQSIILVLGPGRELGTILDTFGDNRAGNHMKIPRRPMGAR